MTVLAELRKKRREARMLYEEDGLSVRRAPSVVSVFSEKPHQLAPQSTLPGLSGDLNDSLFACATRDITESQLRETFQRVVCINLERRPDRWKAFRDRLPADWPFQQVERYRAVDGQKCQNPAWWKPSSGAWGCYRTHLRILEECLNDGIRSVLVLEDDALFDEEFSKKVREFLSHVPANWQMLYLGGQHLKINHCPPLKLNSCVYQPYNVNRTHAYALQGDMLRIVYRHLCRQDWQQGHHIDHHLGRLHQRRAHRIYAPSEWLVGQAGSKSNITGKSAPDRFWMTATQASEPFDSRFVAVVGLHRSGASCLAMILSKLGIHMGNTLGGYGPSSGGEAVGLAQICERAAPFPTTSFRLSESLLHHQLGEWIQARQREARIHGTIAGGKYPHLCVMGLQLRQICGQHLRVIHIDRPLAESIESLKRRAHVADGWLRISNEQAEAVQRWLYDAKMALLREVDHLTIPYHDLVQEPTRHIKRLLDYLDISPTNSQFAAAVAHVDTGRDNVCCDLGTRQSHVRLFPK